MNSATIFLTMIMTFSGHQDVNPIGLTDHMRAFVRDHTDGITNPNLKIHRLVEAIFDEDALNLTYSDDQTQTAAETFLNRSGNCLSFTNLFVAMAREAGFTTYFKEVNDVATWDRRGNVIFHHKHMVAAVYVEGRLMDIDFYPFRNKKKFRLARVINDRRAKAHYFNNLGAEHYAEGNYQRAEQYFIWALEMDDRLIQANLNMGVMKNRLGQKEQAMALFQKVLDEQPRNVPALTNLASLYQTHGQSELAEKTIASLNRFQNRNPYYYSMLAERAYFERDYRKALKYFRKASKLHPKEPLFLLGMGKAYYKMDNIKASEDAFTEAEKRARQRDEETTFLKKIEDLRLTL